MTYGWAILIIAVVMVALFSLGILGGNPLGTSCLPLSGYICQTPVLHLGSFNVIIGQATGTNWVGANIFWIAQGGSSSLLTSAWSCPSYGSANAFTVTNAPICAGMVGTAANPTTGTSIASGATTALGFNSMVAVTTGTTYSGQLWATYYTSSTGGATMYTAQIATVVLKAV